MILFKRRINNAIMTIYLPTFLILCIVYATNYFKEFFFEAVVTVNLTALLVLTTLFISVSESLPPTAYLKMVDVWLIFAQESEHNLDCNLLKGTNYIFQMIPFVEVLLHTWLDIQRDDEKRTINHHGKELDVGPSKMVTTRQSSMFIRTCFTDSSYSSEHGPCSKE